MSKYFHNESRSCQIFLISVYTGPVLTIGNGNNTPTAFHGISTKGLLFGQKKLSNVRR